MRMLQPRRGGDLAAEAVGAQRGGEGGTEELEGDGAVVLEVAREIDGGHAAAAELALEDVAGAEAVLERGARVERGSRGVGDDKAPAWPRRGRVVAGGRV